MTNDPFKGSSEVIRSPNSKWSTNVEEMDSFRLNARKWGSSV